MVEAAWRGKIDEAEVLDQTLHCPGITAQKGPIREVDALAVREGAHPFGRVAAGIEADGHHRKAIRAEAVPRHRHRVLQRLYDDRTGVGAGRENHVHHQGLAPVRGQLDGPAPRVEEAVVTQLPADGCLAIGDRRLRIECDAGLRRPLCRNGRAGDGREQAHGERADAPGQSMHGPSVHGRPYPRIKRSAIAAKSRSPSWTSEAKKFAVAALGPGSRTSRADFWTK